jgi:PAS domain S-box-containing protein
MAGPDTSAPQLEIQALNEEIAALKNALSEQDKRHQAELAAAQRRTEQQMFAYRAAEEERAKLHDLYQNAPCGYQSLAADGLLLDINDTELAWLGYAREQLVGKRRFPDMLVEKDRPRFERYFAAFKERGWIRDIDYDVYRKDGSVLAVSVSSVAIYDAQGRFVKSRTIVLDATERRRVDMALRESEARFKSLTALSSDWFWEQDENFRFLAVQDFEGRRYKRAWSYGVGKTRWEMPYINMTEERWAQHRATLEAHQPFYDFELQRFDDNGKRRYLSISGEPIFDAEACFKGYRGIGRDVTDAKAKQAELEASREKLRHLSRHLQSVRETERTRIAREIHDELGATLTAIKMDLKLLAGEEDLLLAQALRNTIGLVDSAIQTVKKIATDLRPSILDNLGLWAAIEWQGQELLERVGVDYELQIDPQAHELKLDGDRATALFRIVQEALTNVVRHAQADKVTITVQRGRSEVLLEVRDNGKGMHQARLMDSKSWGLLGMYERVRHHGGDLKIDSAVGKGTTVWIRFPVESTA